MVLSPEETEVVLEEQGPSKYSDPDSVDENVYSGVLSLEGVVTAVTSAITGAVLSTSKNGESSEPQELTTSAILEIRKNNKILCIFYPKNKCKKQQTQFRKKISLNMIFNHYQDFLTKIRVGIYLS